MKLQISENFSLPAEAITQTFAILAKRGSGKTYTVLVMVEEFLKANLPVVIVDPVGVCWGLRASADGKSAGLPVVVLGGDHGDVPLEPGVGELIADFIIAERQSCVLDLSRFRKGEQVRFMTDFAERLYHKNRDPLHLVLDEADAFAPQRPQKGQERMLGAVEDIVRRGRAHGLGVTLVTQRAAVLNKDVLTQVEVLVPLRTIAPQDREAIDAWIRVHGTPEQRAELMKSLPSLPIGTAWFWSPGWLDIFQKVKVRKRETFDSSATPKVGQRIESPKTLAQVDLESLKQRIAGTLERAKADDPRELKKQISGLKAELEAALFNSTQVKVERVEVPVIGIEQLRQHEELTKKVELACKELMDYVLGLRSSLSRAAHPGPRPSTEAPRMAVYRQDRAPARGARMEEERCTSGKSGNSEIKLSGGERKILTVLAQYPAGRTKTQVAILTGYAHGGGAFNNYLSSLRSKGFAEGGFELRITPNGLDALGDYEPLPTGTDLIQHWKSQLGKAERIIFEVLISVFPEALPKENLAERAGYAPDGGGFNNALSRLRTLELIEGRGELRASENFFN